MKTHDTTYRFAAGVALAAALFLVWLSLGVGIIGRDGDPANLMYFGVLGVGIIGVAVSSCRAWAIRTGRGMTRRRNPAARPNIQPDLGLAQASGRPPRGREARMSSSCGPRGSP